MFDKIEARTLVRSISMTALGTLANECEAEIVRRQREMHGAGGSLAGAPLMQMGEPEVGRMTARESNLKEQPDPSATNKLEKDPFGRVDRLRSNNEKERVGEMYAKYLGGEPISNVYKIIGSHDYELHELRKSIENIRFRLGKILEMNLNMRFADIDHRFDNVVRAGLEHDVRRLMEHVFNPKTKATKKRRR